MSLKETKGKTTVRQQGDLQIIMSNSASRHNYFAWPSVIRLQNGRIAVAASGYRLAHVCPFGKTVMSVSEDEGETYSAPAPIIDTVLDDRDAGLCVFGEKGLIVTSFNLTTEFQRAYVEKGLNFAYCQGYLDSITEEEECRYWGNTFRISSDCGVTFGGIHRSPVTSPHGPVQLSDGTVLWVGRAGNQTEDRIEAHSMNTEDGTMRYLGQIEPVFRNGKQEKLLSCEPHAIELPNGEILCHIRIQQRNGESEVFTTCQSKSSDGGRTWSKPVQILGDLEGAPSHLLRHSSGMLIATYGRREPPFGIRAMFSRDNGQTWDAGHVIYENTISRDLGYPATVELRDGKLATVFYAHIREDGPAVICQQKWRLEESEP
jgi:sialidase-1